MLKGSCAFAISRRFVCATKNCILESAKLILFGKKKTRSTFDARDLLWMCGEAKLKLNQSKILVSLMSAEVPVEENWRPHLSTTPQIQWCHFGDFTRLQNNCWPSGRYDSRWISPPYEDSVQKASCYWLCFNFHVAFFVSLIVPEQTHPRWVGQAPQRMLYELLTYTPPPLPPLFRARERGKKRVF